MQFYSIDATVPTWCVLNLMVEGQWQRPPQSKSVCSLCYNSIGAASVLESWIDLDPKAAILYLLYWVCPTELNGAYGQIFRIALLKMF